LGKVTDGIKAFGAGIFLFLAGYFWLLPHAYQTDFLGITYFYPVYYYLGWAFVIIGVLSIVAGIGFVILGLIPKKETEIRPENQP
jgi:hypothetical protein